MEMKRVDGGPRGSEAEVTAVTAKARLSGSAAPRQVQKGQTHSIKADAVIPSSKQAAPGASKQSSEEELQRFRVWAQAVGATSTQEEKQLALRVLRQWDGSRGEQAAKVGTVGKQRRQFAAKAQEQVAPEARQPAQAVVALQLAICHQLHLLAKQLCPLLLLICQDTYLNGFA